MKLEHFFNKHPVFTGDELAAFLASEGPRNPRTQESLLLYHVKSGRLARVRRGLYAVAPLGASVASYPVDPFLLASRMTEDAVLAYHTALSFHGRAYSISQRFEFLTATATRPLRFRLWQFRPVSFPRALRRTKKEMLGVQEAERAGLPLHVTTLERTLVDVLDRPDLGGGWEELWRSLEAVEFFNLDQVIEYATILGNATTAAKVGFFLEQHRDSLMVEEGHLARLAARSSKAVGHEYVRDLPALIQRPRT